MTGGPNLKTDIGRRKPPELKSKMLKCDGNVQGAHGRKLVRAGNARVAD
jgi:hypothetical protein